MKLSDVTVEVRDKALNRLGVIRPEELDIEATPLFNNVGTWKLSLAAEHPLADALRTPGAGIIVTGPTDVLFSGPVTKPQYATTPTDPGGTVSYEGITDEHVLSDMLAFPQPSNMDPESQTQSHDVRTGPVETIMHGYVNANIGPSAPVERRNPNLTMGTDGARGNVISKRARFPVLGELLTELATLAGLGFRVVQRDTVLVFETYAIADRRAEIRLDTRNNTLSGQRVAISPPGATRAIVAGQGELTERQFLQVDSPESIAAEAEWGRRIEKFVDQRQTNDMTELQNAGDEVMEESGFTAVAVQAVPTEDSPMRFGTDWYLGDRVTVVVEDQELSSVVTGMVLKANSEGFKVGAVLGDPAGFDKDAALAGRVTSTERRVAALERNSEHGDPANYHVAFSDEAGVADALDVGGFTLSYNDGTGGAQYAPMKQVGSRNSYQGFRFSDMAVTLMVKNDIQGFYRDNGTWAWYFNNGVLTEGTVPGARVTGRVPDTSKLAGMTFNWSGQGGQPSWLWGGNDGVNMYVYNPANFSVAYASNANNATYWGGWGSGNGVFLPNSHTMTNQYPFVFPNLTVGATYTLTLSSGMVMQRNGSSARYKKDIEDLDVDVSKLFELRPRQYRYDNDVPEVDSDERLLGGFIAEEVNEILPLAVLHDPETGLAEDIHDRTLISALTAMVLDLNERLKAQDARIAELEAR